MLSFSRTWMIFLLVGIIAIFTFGCTPPPCEPGSYPINGCIASDYTWQRPIPPPRKFTEEEEKSIDDNNKMLVWSYPILNSPPIK